MYAATDYVAVFAWSFLAATVLPIGSEFAFAALVQHHQQFLLPVLVATLGNSLGAFTTYWLGRRAAAFAARRGPESRGARQAADLVARHGRPIVFFSWVPVLGDALVAAAGAAGMAFGPFAAWVVAGKLARYALLAWTVLSL